MLGLGQDRPRLRPLPKDDQGVKTGPAVGAKIPDFEAVDQIYLFGFSRGATTVRSLSGFIDLFGIMPNCRSELIKRAYKIYRISDSQQREEAAKAFRQKNHTMWTRIRFLGVWDTVAALGVPVKGIDDIVDMMPWFKHSFHNLQLSPSVEHAYHALAIDEERKAFLPVLWEPTLKAYQTMKQVWFCGMHSDVGGGYAEPALSDLALEWLVAMACNHGLKLYPRHTVQLNPDPNGYMHDSRGGKLSRFFKKAVRTWPVATHGRPTVHESVSLRTRGNQQNRADTPYASWILDLDPDVEPWVRLPRRDSTNGKTRMTREASIKQ